MSAPWSHPAQFRSVARVVSTNEDYDATSAQDLLRFLERDEFAHLRFYSLLVSPKPETLRPKGIRENDPFLIDCIPEQIKFRKIRTFLITPVIKTTDPSLIEACLSGRIKVGDQFRCVFKFNRTNDPVETIRKLAAESKTARDVYIETALVRDFEREMPCISMGQRDLPQRNDR